MNLEQALRELADADARTKVPGHVAQLVMAQWDAVSAAQQSRRRRPLWHVVLASAALGGCAVGLVLTVVRWPAPVLTPEAPAVVVSPAGVAAEEPTLAPVMREPEIAVVVPDELPAVRRRLPARSRETPVLDAGYVLVPDAALPPSELMVMRVRMPRSAFARLGVPIANPDAEGFVDVELLVGEDGVARSIRRASAVGWTEEQVK